MRAHSSLHRHPVSPEVACLSERPAEDVSDGSTWLMRQLYRKHTCAPVLGMADWTPQPMSPAMSGLCGALVAVFAVFSAAGSGPGQIALQSFRHREDGLLYDECNYFQSQTGTYQLLVLSLRSWLSQSHVRAQAGRVTSIPANQSSWLVVPKAAQCPDGCKTGC